MRLLLTACSFALIAQLTACGTKGPLQLPPVKLAAVAATSTFAAAFTHRDDSSHPDQGAVS